MSQHHLQESLDDFARGGAIAAALLLLVGVMEGVVLGWWIWG
jgi:hypothetical protein